MVKTIYWNGPDGPRNVEEMSRDELLDAVRYAVGQLEYYQRDGMARAYALGSVEMWKRGEKLARLG